MREILFRGKRTDIKKWQYGSLVTRNETHFISKDKYIEEVDPETIGQFTGILDKNGTKIFEGDILGVAGKPITFRTVTFGCYKYDIEIDAESSIDVSGLGFYLKSQFSVEPFYLINGPSPLLSVIGNIHDNPELLEELK